jgi:heme/copper-type cytochrome/quinol oxidase subunit 2
MSSVLAPVLADAAEEGRNIVLSMLVVGLIFIAVILLGELNTWLSHRRKRAGH